MPVITYTIQKKTRQPGSIRLASFADFLVERDGVLDEREIINNRSLSLYCIDHPNRLVVFVQTKEENFLWVYFDRKKGKWFIQGTVE